MLGTRAVERRVLERNEADCRLCGAAIKFKAMTKATQIIANVYEGDRWNRVEHYHAECYIMAGEPYGYPTAKAMR